MDIPIESVLTTGYCSTAQAVSQGDATRHGLYVGSSDSSVAAAAVAAAAATAAADPTAMLVGEGTALHAPEVAQPPAQLPVVSSEEMTGSEVDQGHHSGHGPGHSLKGTGE